LRRNYRGPGLIFVDYC